MYSRARVLTALVLSATLTTEVHAVLTALDNFDYSPIGSDLNGNGAGDFGFSGPWTGQTSYNIGSGSLQTRQDPLPLIGNSMTTVAFGENRGIDRTLATPLGTEDTSIYISGLMQPRGILHQGAYDGWFGLALRGSTTIVVGMVYQSGNYGLEVGFERALTPTQAVIGRTEFFVLRIDFTEGVDPVYLYLNPEPGAPEPATPTVSEINLNVNFINTVSLTGPGSNAFDALRIGTTYADVAPATSDFNDDGSVNGEDLAAWTAGYGPGPLAATEGDADLDQDVDGKDFLIWQRQAGYQSTSIVASSVPEPTANCILVAMVTCRLTGRTTSSRTPSRRRTSFRRAMSGRSNPL
jgi:hypothetical protein